MTNIPLCPGSIILLDSDQYQIYKLSPVLYLVNINYANTN